MWETSPLGPFDAWPTGGGGFEHFYGFIGGETNQYAPAIYDGTTPIEPDRTPEEGYHFTEDMTDQAIDWIRQQKALMPDKPFFVYFAPGATHAPHHVPPEWSDKYKGRFDDGWDALRERTLARQKELGVVPEDAELTARPAEIPAWDDMPDELKPVLARQMEVYAGFLEHTDHHIGRLIDALDDLGILDDTLVYYIIGDNGASAEGTPNGCFNELAILNGAFGLETVEFMASRIDDFGTPRGVQPLRGRLGARDGRSLPVDEADRVALGRHAQRHDRPLARRDPRQGRDPLPVPPRDRHRGDRARRRRLAGAEDGPRRRADAARRRVDDATPSTTRARRPPHDPVLRDVLQSGHLPRGLDCRDAAQHPVDGDRDAGVRRRRLGALRPGRLDAGARPRRQHPDKLAELQRLFLDEAKKYNVLPLDDRRFERFNPDLAGRPQLVHGTSQLLFGRMGRLSENSILALKNKSHAITAEIVVPEGGANGVILSQGGAFGGFALYAKDGTTGLLLQPLRPPAVQGLRRGARFPQASTRCAMEFAYDGGGLGKGGDVTLFVDGEPVGEGRVEATVPMLFSADETTDVGSDTATPVSDDYGARDSEFTGKVRWVQLDIDEAAEDADHLISPEERLQIAMARQ